MFDFLKLCFKTLYFFTLVVVCCQLGETDGMIFSTLNLGTNSRQFFRGSIMLSDNVREYGVQMEGVHVSHLNLSSKMKQY